MSGVAKVIYIASPYRNGNLEENVITSLEAAEAVIRLGHIPYPPLLNHYWGKIFHHEQDFWLMYDLVFLARCDALVRLPGKSEGADGEVKFAEENGIPVYYGLNELGVHLAGKD